MFRQSDGEGFSLIEVVIAIGLVAVLSASVAQLTVLSGRVLAHSRVESAAVRLAVNRLEELRALAWGYGTASRPVPARDTSTGLDTETIVAGGRGLAPSPADALDTDRPGYVDYLDEAGRWLANSSSPPDAARFVRRWSVRDVPGYPDLVLICVRVIDRRSDVQNVDVATIRTRTAG